MLIYKVFILQNKYFKTYDDNTLDMEIINKLIELGLNNNDIALFYNFTREYISQVIEIFMI